MTVGASLYILKILKSWEIAAEHNTSNILICINFCNDVAESQNISGKNICLDCNRNIIIIWLDESRERKHNYQLKYKRKRTMKFISYKQ